MTLPLEVYLDSSDFSQFADPGERSEEIRDIERYLLMKKAEGKIVLRYSASHVIEAAATREEDIPAASARLAKIGAICGTACFAHFLDISEDEVRQARCGELRSRMAVQREDGFWYPRALEVALFSSPQSPMKLLESLGRKERRRLLRDDKLTPLARQELGGSMQSFLLKPPAEIPLGHRTMAVLKDYFDGRVSSQIAEQKMRCIIGDVREFGRWYETDPNSAIQFSSHLRELGRELQDLLKSSREEYSQLLDSAVAAGHRQDILKQIADEAFAKMLRETSVRLARSLSVTMGLGGDSIDSAVSKRSLLGINCAIALVLHVARRAVFDAKPRKGGDSDVGDILHAVYLPYVDIFRTDGSMANVIREAKLAGSTEVVGKLSKLRETIERRLDVCRDHMG